MKFINLLSVATALSAGTAMAAPAENSALIATDQWYACNPPNNFYGSGHSCKYKAGGSTGGATVSGHCKHWVHGQFGHPPGLYCDPTF